MRRPRYILWVVLVVLVVSTSSLAVLLVRSETGQRHDVASIPDEPVLSDDVGLAKAWQATTEFQSRLAHVGTQIEQMATEPRAQATAERAELADELNMLIMLRCAVTGTGAELEERLARRGDVEGNVVVSTADAYAHFSIAFDRAVVDYLSGYVSQAMATNIADTSTLVIEGPDPRVTRSLQAVADAVTTIREELRKVAQRFG